MHVQVPERLKTVILVNHQSYDFKIGANHARIRVFADNPGKLIAGAANCNNAERKNYAVHPGNADYPGQEYPINLGIIPILPPDPSITQIVATAVK